MAGLLDALASDKKSKTSAFYSYIQEKANQKRLPLIGTFELTPRCTLDCSMCYVHLRPDQMYRDELSTDQWIDLIDQASDAGMMYAHVTGGECMLHPGFRDICQRLFDHGIIVSILTNGTLIDKETAVWLLHDLLDRVQITVYGSSADEYGKVTGNSEAFYRVDHALDILNEVGIRFTTPITLSKPLAPYFMNIARYCHSKKSLRTTVTPNPFPARPETGRRIDDYSITLQEEVNLYKLFYDMEGLTYTPFNLDEELEAYPLMQTGMACNAGRSLFSISWDGKMTPCNAIYWLKADTLEVGFKRAWDVIKQYAAEFQYPSQCNGCKFRRACIPCPVVHYNPNTHESELNEHLCRETRELVAVGIHKIT